MELKRVVVTGLGAISPLGLNLSETWENILQGKSGAGPITHFDASMFKTRFACEVKGFDPSKYFDRKEARKLDMYAQYAIAAAQEAIENCGVDLETLDKDEVGVIFAAGIGGIQTFEQEIGYYYSHEEQGPKFNPFFIPKMISDIWIPWTKFLYHFSLCFFNKCHYRCI